MKDALGSIVGILVLAAIGVAAWHFFVGGKDGPLLDRKGAFERNLEEFISKNDPALAAKRSEIVKGIAENRKIRESLLDRLEEYPNEEARQVLRGRATKYEALNNQLERILREIDLHASVAMAHSEAGTFELAGLQIEESKSLISTASNSLKHAEQLRQGIESEGLEVTGDVDLQEVGQQRPLTELESETVPPIMPKGIDEEVAKQEVPPPTEDKTESINSLRNELTAIEAQIRHQRNRWKHAESIRNLLTDRKRKPMVKGSRQHYQYMAATEVIQQVESLAPELLKKKAKLEGLLKQAGAH